MSSFIHFGHGENRTKSASQIRRIASSAWKPPEPWLAEKSPNELEVLWLEKTHRTICIYILYIYYIILYIHIILYIYYIIYIILYIYHYYVSLYIYIYIVYYIYRILYILYIYIYINDGFSSHVWLPEGNCIFWPKCSCLNSFTLSILHSAGI